MKAAFQNLSHNCMHHVTTSFIKKLCTILMQDFLVVAIANNFFLVFADLQFARCYGVRVNVRTLTGARPQFITDAAAVRR